MVSQKNKKIILILGLSLIATLILTQLRFQPKTYETINLNKFEDWDQVEKHEFTKLKRKDDHLFLVDNNQLLRAFAVNTLKEEVIKGELVVNLKVLDNKDGYFFLNLKDSKQNIIFQIFRNNYGDYYFITDEVNLFLFDEDGSWNTFNISFNCRSDRYDFSLEGSKILNNYLFDAESIAKVELLTHQQTFQSKTEIDFQLFKVWE